MVRFRPGGNYKPPALNLPSTLHRESLFIPEMGIPHEDIQSFLAEGIRRLLSLDLLNDLIDAFHNPGEVCAFTPGR